MPINQLYDTRIRRIMGLRAEQRELHQRGGLAPNTALLQLNVKKLHYLP